jgi:hypothetical protein
MSNHIAEMFDAPFGVLERVFTKGCFVTGCITVVIYHISLLALGAAIGRWF